MDCHLSITHFILKLVSRYSRVSFCDGSSRDDSHLRPSSSRTERSRLVAPHCRSSSVLSVLNAPLALSQRARVSSFSTLVQFFEADCDFSTRDIHQRDRGKKKTKQLALHSFLMSSEPWPGPSSAKLKVICLIFFFQLFALFFIYVNSLS